MAREIPHNGTGGTSTKAWNPGKRVQQVTEMVKKLGAFPPVRCLSIQLEIGSGLVRMIGCPIRPIDKRLFGDAAPARFPTLGPLKHRSRFAALGEPEILAAESGSERIGRSEDVGIR